MAGRKRYTTVVQAVPAPPGKTEQQTAVAAGAAWGVLATFEAGKYRYAHVRLKDADAFLAFQEGAEVPTKDGCSYPVHAPLKIEIDPEADTLVGKRDDAGTNAAVTWSLVED